MRRRVDLPQPEGPRGHEFPIGDRDRYAMDHLLVAIAFTHVNDFDRSHLFPFIAGVLRPVQAGGD